MIQRLCEYCSGQLKYLRLFISDPGFSNGKQGWYVVDPKEPGKCRFHKFNSSIKFHEPGTLTFDPENMTEEERNHDEALEWFVKQLPIEGIPFRIEIAVMGSILEN